MLLLCADTALSLSECCLLSLGELLLLLLLVSDTLFYVFGSGVTHNVTNRGECYYTYIFPPSQQLDNKFL